MPKYENLIQIDGVDLPGLDGGLSSKKKKAAKKAKTPIGKGCENCPNGEKAKKYPPIFGKVKGKRIFIFAQNPGWKEFQKHKELIGPSGELLWRELKAVGIKRKHCDIQNSVRCFTYDRDELGYKQGRTPTKEEVHCCSIYTDKALEKSKAKVYLILGQVAAKQVLGSEYRKGRNVFWSDKLNARVVCNLHPAYFLRGGSKSKLEEFRANLRVVAQEAFGDKVKTPDGLERFSHLLKQKYIKVDTTRSAKKAYKDIIGYVKRGERVAPDFEWHKDVGLCYGFSPKRGLTYVFILDHPKNKASESDKRYCKRIVKRLLGSPKIKKVFHHGCSDLPATQRIYRWKVRGYRFDSELAAYFYDSSIKKYGLSSLAEKWWPEFAGYKEVTMPECLPKGIEYKAGRKYGKLDYSKVPINKLVLYNAADCDLSKRIERKTKNIVVTPLMGIYVDASFTVDRMQSNGPMLDYKHLEIMEKIYPYWVKTKTDELREICKRPKFNPNSNPQKLEILYDEEKGFGLEPITIFKKGKEIEAKNCRATTLELLLETDLGKKPRKFITTFLEYSENNSINTKALKSFRKSADAHEGLLKTNWWLTGTITYRLRSGGSQENDDSRGIVNLQNIPLNFPVKNLLIADENWSELFDHFREKCFSRFKKKHSHWEILFEMDEKTSKFTQRSVTLRDEFFKWTDYELPSEFENLYTFAAWDFSQLEMRVLAEMADEKKLIEYFLSGVDYHSAVGSELTGWPIEKIQNDDTTRRLVKAINFSIVYGKMPKGLYQQLINEGVKITFRRVEELWNAFWKKYKRVKALFDHFRQMGEELGYVETLFGARRPIGDDDRSTFTENQSINTPIQGTAHQLVVIILAMLERRKQQELKRLQDLRMEVHDSLNFRNKLKRLPEVNATAKKLMERDVLDEVKREFGYKWRVPLEVDGKAGLRFGTMVKIGKEVDMKRWVNEWCLLCYQRKLEINRELEKVRTYS